MAKNTFKKHISQVKAIALMASSAIYIMIFGGSRSGKTAIIVYAIINRAAKSPGSRHLILRRYFAHAKQSIWYDTFPKVAGMIGITYKENKQDWFMELANGSQIWIGGLDDKQRADKILGKEYASIYFNESSEHTWRSVRVALTRLAQKCEVPTKLKGGGIGSVKLVNRAYFDMNPPAKSHWTHKVFIEHKDPSSDSGKGLEKPELYGAMQMNPHDNVENISDDYIENVLETMSEREKKRFLYGEFTSDIEGALWTYDLIEKNKVDEAPECEKVCIAIDPATTSNPDSDDTGIVASGKLGNMAYVFEDATGKYTPLGWATKAVELYYKYEADFIVAESNQGGEMVKEMIRQVDDTIRVKLVHAKKGKALRAEPVVGLYEQGRVKHVGEGLMKLEQEMTDWDASDSSAPSPNRLDAMVYSIIFLMLKKSVTFVSKSAFAV